MKKNENIYLPKSSKQIKLKLFLNFTLIDLLCLTFTFSLMIICLVLINNLLIRILVIIIFLIISVLLILPIGNKKIYTYCYLAYKYYFLAPKKINFQPLIDFTSKQNSLINKNYQAYFVIEGVNLNLLSEDEQNIVFYEFWQLIKNLHLNFSFIKIPAKFNFDNYFQNLASTINSQYFGNYQKFLNSEIIIDNELKYSQIYLILSTKDEQKLVNQINMLIHSFNFKYLKITKTDNTFLKYFYQKFNFSATSFANDQKKAFLYQLYQFPLKVYPTWLKDFFSIDDSYIWINSQNIKKELAKKKLDNILDRLTINARRHYKNSDQIQTANLIDAINLCQEEIVSDIDNYKYINIYFGSIANQHQLLKKIEIDFKHTCLKNDVKYDNLRFQQQLHFNNLLLFNYVSDVNTFEMTSNNFSSSFFLNSQWVFDNTGIVLGKDENNYLISLDIFKLTNFRINHNVLIFGTSGSGKTTLAQKILQFENARHSKIFIIDPEDEYKDWASKNNGLILDLSGNQYHLNPLEIFEKIIDIKEAINQKLLELEGFFSYLYPDISKEHLQIILNICYALLTKTLTKSKIVKTWPILADVYQLAKKDKLNYSKISYYLEPLITRYGKYWNGQTNIKIDHQYQIFCAHLKELSFSPQANILGIQVFLLTQYINKLILANQKSNENFVIFIDEAHRLVNDNNAMVLQYLANLAKRVRKYHTSLFLVTQNIYDFTGNINNQKYFSAILNNAQYKFYGGLQPADITALDDLLISTGGLTEQEKMFLTVAKRGSFIFSLTNTNRLTLQVIISDQGSKE